MYKISEGEISFDAWVEKYKPIKNTITEYPDTSAEYGMFETYGAEVEFVKAQDPRNIWTYLDGDLSTLIVQGFSYVNRVGYYVCEVPWTDGEPDFAMISVETECVCYRSDNDGEWGDSACTICEGSGYATEYVD